MSINGGEYIYPETQACLDRKFCISETAFLSLLIYV